MKLCAPCVQSCAIGQENNNCTIHSNATSICSNQDRALCLINTTKLRGQYSQYKGIWLEMRHSSTYREIALAFAEQPSEAAKYDQIAILLEILVLLPLANAVSEGGFSLQTA